MTIEQPMTLRQLAEKIQRGIAKAKAAEDPRTGYLQAPGLDSESISETRLRIRKANDL